MLQLFTKKHRGFTLIELLVVIAIIGVLASIVLVSMGGARRSARDAVRKADMRQLITAQEMYYGANDDYYTCSALGGDCGGEVNNYPALIGDAGATYMAKTPADPGTTVYMGVDNTGDAQKFCYYSTLEGVSGQYYVASHAGNFCFTAVPDTLPKCGGTGMTVCP